MSEQQTLTSELQAMVGHDAVEGGEAISRYRVDGAEPNAMVSPASSDEVASVLRYANERGLAVIVWGGGSEIQTGNTADRYDITLSPERLNALLEHEPADLTATCQAGMTLDSLQSALAKHGQAAPFDPHLPKNASIGGLLATNAFGASRHAYGTPRDFTIGANVVTGDGLITKAGGKVVKNVAGYDMCKLYIGSRGTLGVITEATFKLMPLPTATDGLAFGVSSATTAAQFAADVYARGLSIRSAVVANAVAAKTFGEVDGPVLVALEFAGTRAGVDRSMREGREFAASAGLDEVADVDLLNVLEAFVDPGEADIVIRFSTLPSRVASLIQAMERTVPGSTIVAAPLCGVLRVSWTDSRDQLLPAIDLVTSTEASVIIERCPAESKATIDVFGESPSSLGLMRRIKQQYDPASVLSPGRFVGRL